MPTLFEDPDGIIQSVTWTFDEGVVLKLEPFSHISFTSDHLPINPYVAWSTSGVRT